MKKWQYIHINELKNNIYKSQKAFTLIELLVVIAMVGIIILGTNLMSYNNISNKQELETKVAQISAQIEIIRNNALLGKGIGTDLIVPEKYKIDFSTSGSGIIKTYYFSGSTYKDYNFFDKNIDFTNFNEIYRVRCFKLNDPNPINSFTPTNIGTGTIIIEGANLTLSGGCSLNTKILELKIKRKTDIKEIQINTINGLIEIKK